MKKVLLALLGLLLLAILAYFCFQNKADTIREHLVSSTNSALNSNDITGVTATLQGSDVEMTDIIRLTGEVPSLEVKAKAEALTRAIDGMGNVDNQLSIAKQSAVSTSEDEETTVPKTTSLATDDKASTKDAYTLNIIKDEEGHVALEGHVESKQRKEELFNYAQKLFGSENVTDKLQVTAGAPKNWEYIANFALDRLKDVDYGDMKLSNQSYEFTGHLPSPSTKANFLDGIRKVMSDPENKYSLYRGDYIITAPVEEPNALVKKEEPAVAEKAPTVTKTTPVVTKNSIKVCQGMLDDLLAKEKILFDYNKASIKRDSYTILNRALDSMKACNLSSLEIAGHTDNQGSSVYNQRLSKLRANSVKNYFVKQGFDQEKLQAIGYGESQPIASNKSSQGRAENRRIELIVKGVER